MNSIKKKSKQDITKEELLKLKLYIQENYSEEILNNNEMVVETKTK